MESDVSFSFIMFLFTEFQSAFCPCTQGSFTEINSTLPTSKIIVYQLTPKSNYMTTESPKLLDPRRPARRNSSSRSGTARQFTVPHRQIINRAGEQLAELHPQLHRPRQRLVGCACDARRPEEVKVMGMQQRPGYPAEGSVHIRNSVRSMILKSSQMDQFSMYHRSYLVRSSMDESPRSPLTCAQPVSPAFSRWRSM